MREYFTKDSCNICKHSLVNSNNDICGKCSEVLLDLGKVRYKEVEVIHK